MPDGPSSGSRAPLPSNPNVPLTSPGQHRTSEEWIGPAIILVYLIPVILLVAVLWVTVPGPPPRISPPPPTPGTFSAAWSAANETVDARGTWILGRAIGYDLAGATFVNPLVFTTANQCNITTFAGHFTNSLLFLASPHTLTNGVAEEWVLSYFQPSNSSEILVFETLSVVSLAFELSGANCQAGTFGSQFLHVGSPVNSSVAVARGLSWGGTQFLAFNTSGVSLEMDLGGEFGWAVTWTTCAVFPFNQGYISPGEEFSLVMNETTDAVVPLSPFSGTCGSIPGQYVGEALRFGIASLSQETHSGTLASQGCQFADFCYTVPIWMASQNVTPWDLALGVFQNGNGDNGVVGYAILNCQGQVIVSASGPYEGAGSASWTPGVGTANTTLTDTMYLTVDMGTGAPEYQGYVLGTTGWTASYADEVYSVPLP